MMTRETMTIRWLTLALGFMFTALASYSMTSYRQAQSDAELMTRNLVQVLESRLSSDFAESNGALNFIARSISEDELRPTLPARKQAEITAHLADLEKSFPNAGALTVFDAEGTLRFAANPKLKGINIADRPHFRALRDDPTKQTTFSDAEIARISGKWAIVMVRALRDDRGRFVGTANAVISLDKFSALFDAIDVGPGGITLLRRSDTSTLIQRTPRNREQDFNQALPLNNPIRQRIDAGERAGTLNLIASVDGVKRLASFKTLDNAPFYVQVAIANDHYLAGWKRGAILSAILAISLLLGYWFAVRKIRKAAAAADSAEDALRKSEAFVQDILNSVESQIAVIDHNGVILDINEAWQKFSQENSQQPDQKAPNSFIGTNYLEMCRADSPAGSVEALGASEGILAVLGGRLPTFSLDYTCHSPHQQRWFKLTVTPLNVGGQRGAVVAHDNITGSKMAEQELAQRQQRLSNILWGTGAGTWEWNVQTGETHFNERWAEMVGYRLDELSPVSIDTWMRLAHPDDLAQSGELLARHFAGELDFYEFEARMRHKNGHWIWVQDRGKVVSRTADGQPEWMAGTHSEITARKQSEAALRSSEERLKEAQRMASTGNWELDLVSGQLRWSDEIFRIFEIDKAQFAASYEAFLSAIHPDDRDAVNAAYTESLKDRLPYSIEHRLLFADGRIKQVREECETTFDESGQPLRSSGTVQDITERKRAEHALQQQATALARSNAELEQFAYVASHDLRQPLRMVNSYVQLLERTLRDKLDDKTREMMHYVTDGAKRMDQMLVSLLDYSRVGRKGEPLAPLESRSGVDEALRFLAPAIREANATVRVSGDWPQLIASRDEFTRLWQNLIGNAVKYRVPDRPPEIDITVEPEGEGWRFCVADNGIGIEPTQFARLFKVFQRLHTRDQFEGNGIGLAVARKIVERHGGRIWVESAGIGLGCRFYFSLPPIEVAVAMEVTP